MLGSAAMLGPSPLVMMKPPQMAILLIKYDKMTAIQAIRAIHENHEIWSQNRGTCGLSFWVDRFDPDDPDDPVRSSAGLPPPKNVAIHSPTHMAAMGPMAVLELFSNCIVLQFIDSK